MKKIVLTSLLILSSSMAMAETSNTEDAKQLFDCVNSETLIANSECISNQINRNATMQAQFDQLDERFNQQDINLLSIVTLNPLRNEISVVAYQPAE